MSEQELTADPTVRRAARAAARRLAKELDPALPIHVEAVLATDELSGPTGQFAVDPVALGSLIVSAASLTWTIVKDTREQAPKPSRETITQRVRLELPEDGVDTDDQRQRIIEVVVKEIIDGPGHESADGGR